LKAVGYVTKQTDGRYKGTLRTVSIKADIDMLPNSLKPSGIQVAFRMMTEADVIGVGEMHKGEASNKEHVSVGIAAPEFEPKILYAKLNEEADVEATDFMP
jgi:uncharacterized protein (DUF736 family)